MAMATVREELVIDLGAGPPIPDGSAAAACATAGSAARATTGAAASAAASAATATTSAVIVPATCAAHGGGHGGYGQDLKELTSRRIHEGTPCCRMRAYDATIDVVCVNGFAVLGDAVLQVSPS
jgi:hypothetical protein